MNSSDLRKSYLDFFASNGHRVVPSDSLLPANDPTLLFTSAGMVQFKPYYVAKEKPFTRATSSQRCLRTSDIERVGSTARHLTFFEMLGNFSFGDYFKEGAIAYAWEYLTKTLKLDPKLMYMSVYEKDDEAEKMWTKFVPASRIIRFGNEDNYWPAGSVLDTWAGPNGPCSEIYYDFGARHCTNPSSPCDRPGVHECDRWREIWNLVFPQFMRSTATGENPPMAKPGIDTGMGLERLATVIQGKDNLFDTDLFAPIMEKTGEFLVPRDAKTERAYRIVADHARAATFMVHDGVMPSNEGRGYVLRRLIRRATRFAALMPREGRGQKPLLAELVPLVVSIMGTHYESLNGRQKEIIEVVRAEEERFLSVVERGASVIRELEDQGDTLAGDKAFFLWDTFGFPRELTEDIWVREMGKKLSPKYEAEYRGALEAQQGKARAAWKGSGGKALGELYHSLADEMGPTPFTGYQLMAMKTRVVAVIRRGGEGSEGVRVKEAGRGETVDLILEKTPFYAESGGQVTDTGSLLFPGGKAEVLGVAKPVGDMFVHTVKVVEGSINEGASVDAGIDAPRRWAVMRHHTSTHLLHASLHRIVGPQATQAGSLVAPDRFRFDFMSQKAVDLGQLRAVEELVNMKVLENLPVTVTETTMAEAKKHGVMALFGEKYGERVRMVEVADFSKELCGGTHVPATGNIGPFLITSEGAVAAGVRRIEGVAGTAAIEAMALQRASMERAAALLKCPVRELEERIEKTLADHRALEAGLEALKTKMAQKDLDSRSSASEEIGGVKVLLIEADAPDPGILRELADRALESLKEGIVVIGARGEGKCSLVARVSSSTSKRVTAGELVKVAAEIVGGSGGGKPEMAQAGGKLPEKLGEALAKVREHLRAKLGA